MDTMTAEERSRCMAAIKSGDTKPEMIVRRFLHARGFRYGLHNRKLPGSPDIVLRKHRTVIFINGCFWHGHEGCRLYRLPKSNVEFWEKKIARNIARDARTHAALVEMGWRVITIWECELRTVALRDATLAALPAKIRGAKPFYSVEEDSPAIAAEPEADFSSPGVRDIGLDGEE